MPEVSVEDCLRKWRRKYGEERTGKSHGQTYHAIPIKERRRLLIIFFRWMRMSGQDRERFSRPSFMAEIIPICFGSAPAFDEKKRKRGHEALKEEIKDILAVEGIFDGKKSKNNRNFRPSESAALVEQVSAPVPTAKKTPVEPVPEEERFGKEVDRSLYAHLPKTQVVLDEEFAKLIGVDPNE